MNIYLFKHAFIPNKYTETYFKLVEKALSENRTKGEQYYEIHHILPKSLFPEFKNLSKNKWNSVLFTAREHFIGHKLLIRMIEDKTSRAKMLHAVVRLMHGSKNKTYTSREYEYYSILASKEHSIFIKGNKYSFGKKWYHNPETLETKSFSPGSEPIGWLLGRANFKKENNSVSGTKWFWNPDTQEKGMFAPGNEPKDWVLGRGSIASKGKKSYYHPETKETKRFEPGKQPKDWIPGFGTILGENHWNYGKGAYK